VLSIRLAAELDSLKQLHRCVADLAAAGRLASTQTYHLRLATEEIATNIIAHGIELDPAGDPVRDRWFRVEGYADEDRVWIRLTDSASPFDPTRMADPETLDRPLEERPVGGLGIYLVRQVLDEFTYERVGGLNRTTLAIRRRKPDEMEDS
jgi:serine/threonine-protein kinase RsbW